MLNLWPGRLSDYRGNGLEFHSQDFKRMGWELGIDMTYCRVRTPWLKPHVERFFAGLGFLTLTSGRVRKVEANVIKLDPYKDASITIGRLFRSVLEFLDYYEVVDVEERMPEETKAIFSVLSDEYQFKLHDSLRKADEVENANPIDPMDPDADPVRMDCDQCGNHTMVVNEESGTGYRCTFCANEDGDDLPADCSSCGAHMTSGDLETWNEEHGVEYRCYYCSGRYAADRDRD